MNYDLYEDEPHQGAGAQRGTVARSIERRTAKLPSDLFSWAAFGSIGGSLAFKLAGKDHAALFVGQWAPTSFPVTLYREQWNKRTDTGVFMHGRKEIGKHRRAKWRKLPLCYPIFLRLGIDIFQSVMPAIWRV